MPGLRAHAMVTPMHDTLHDALPYLPTFVRLAQTGSMSQTARDLAVPRSTVSRRLTRLEDMLGVPLAERTNRTLRLTPAGHALADGAREHLDALTTLGESVRAIGGALTGTLRIAVPPGLSGPYFGPFLTEFRARCPLARVEVLVQSRPPHPIDDDFDLVLAAGPLDDAPWLRKALGQSPSILVAAPSYLAARGTPETPADLNRHALLSLRGGARAPTRWPRRDLSGELSIAPLVITNDLSSLLACAESGQGIALLPAHLAADALRAGRLTAVLTGSVGEDVPLYVLYTAARKKSPLVRAVLDSIDAFAASLTWPSRHAL